MRQVVMNTPMLKPRDEPSLFALLDALEEASRENASQVNASEAALMIARFANWYEIEAKLAVLPQGNPVRPLGISAS